MPGLHGHENVPTLEDYQHLRLLMEVLRLPPETDFLVYRVLLDCGGDFQMVFNKLLEAQCEYRSLEILRERIAGEEYPAAESFQQRQHQIQRNRSSSTSDHHQSNYGIDEDACGGIRSACKMSRRTGSKQQTSHTHLD